MYSFPCCEMMLPRTVRTIMKNLFSPIQGSCAVASVVAAKRFTLFAAVLLVAAHTSALGQENKKTDPAQVVDSGSFGIFLGGKRIGTETFIIQQQSGVGVLTAEIKVDDGASKSEQSCEMQVTSDGDLRLYKWKSISPSREESVVEPKDQLLVEHVMPAGHEKEYVPYIVPLSTVILDDNFFSQRELLIWRYLATGCASSEGQLHCGPAKFGTLVPHQHLAGSATLELLGRDKITVKDVKRELNKVKLDADDVHWLIWVDDPENQYKVIKMAVPAANLEVIRD